MDRAEYLASYCASIDCKSTKLGDCDLCIYAKGRADAIEECIKVVDEVNWLESDTFIDLLKKLKEK